MYIRHLPVQLAYLIWEVAMLWYNYLPTLRDYIQYRKHASSPTMRPGYPVHAIFVRRLLRDSMRIDTAQVLKASSVSQGTRLNYRRMYCHPWWCQTGGEVARAPQPLPAMLANHTTYHTNIFPQS